MHAFSLDDFFAPAHLAPELLHAGRYNAWLVALSVAIAMFSAWMALLSLDATRHQSSRALRVQGFMTGSLALGCGIWAMHFIGILAFDLGTPASYDAAVTALSVLPGIVAAVISMTILSKGGRARATLMGAGVMIGLSIGAMHYIGMAGLQVWHALRYDPVLFVASLLVAIVLSTVALWLHNGADAQGSAVDTAWRRACSAGALGAAFASLHYLAMAGARFIGDGSGPVEVAYDPVMLALLIALLTVTLTAVVTIANGFLRHREFFLELSNSEARLRALLSTAVDGVITISATGIIEEFNASAEHIFQWRRDEIVGRNVRTLMWGDYASEHDGYLKNYLRTGHAEIIGTGREVTGLRKDGSHVPIRLAIGHARVGTKDLFVGFVTDISERRSIEHALRQSEAQFRSLIGNIPGIAYRCTTDENWPMLFISDNVERLTGYPAADFLGDSPRMLFGHLIHPADRAYTEQQAAAAIASGQPFLIEYRLLHRDGSVRWMWENGSPAADGDGTLNRFDGVILDITERKRSELDVQRFSAIVTSSNDAIISKDLSGVITSWNRGAEKIFGYSADEAIGKPMLLLFPPDRVNEEREILLRIAKGEKVDHFDTIRRRKNGSLVDISTTVSPILDSREQIIGASTISRDISERRQMEQALLEAKETAERAAVARSAFLANMSHEIRTPMNAILGFTEVLLQGDLDDSQRRHLDTVRNSARALLRLLNEVLDTAKLDRGVVDLELKDFDLLNLIDELSSTLGAEARDKGLALHIRYADTLPGVFHGDELRIRQVLTNLLGNAIKFTEKGSVVLHVEPDGDALHIMVQDTGIGIPAHRLQAIFEPFTQADASMSRRFGGTGLGTTISKKLVELMGGRISVESLLDAGTTFHVWLPLIAATPAEAALDLPRGLPALPPQRILIADDVPQNLELLSLLLEQHGHTVVAVEDGVQALHRASAEPFDLVLMDVQMPGMDGLQATRLLRLQETASGKPSTPVIALTASVMDADRNAAREAGMDGFTSKPVDIAALQQEMARVLLPAQTLGTADTHTAPLQVLDYQRGLARWAHHQSVFERSLRSFVRDHAGLHERLAHLLGDDEPSQARALAHKTRGVAANLGLERLEARLHRIEGAISSQEPEGWVLQLALLQGDLNDALDAIAAQVPSDLARVRALPAHALDANRVNTLAERLDTAFGRGQFDETSLAAFVDATHGHVQASDLDGLRRAVEDFDFSTASAELSGMRNRLAQTLKDAD